MGTINSSPALAVLFITENMSAREWQKILQRSGRAWSSRGSLPPWRFMGIFSPSASTLAAAHRRASSPSPGSYRADHRPELRGLVHDVFPAVTGDDVEENESPARLISTAPTPQASAAETARRSPANRTARL